VEKKMNFEKAYSKVVAGLATGIRGDISIADSLKLDGVTSHVLLEYQPKLGKPSGNDIERYFAKVFEGKIVPIMSSCSIKTKCISVLARLNVPTRPLEDSANKESKLVPIIAGMMYLDKDLGDHWEVKEDAGKKILAKTTKENIEQIIAARRNRMFVTKTPGVSLASVTASTYLLCKGDVVKAYHNGNLVEAEVLAAIPGGFKLKLGDKEIMVAKEEVTDLMAMEWNDRPEERNALKKYYEEAFGDRRYAEMLVKAK
jgi:hypothetical protein